MIITTPILKFIVGALLTTTVIPILSMESSDTADGNTHNKEVAAAEFLGRMKALTTLSPNARYLFKKQIATAEDTLKQFPESKELIEVKEQSFRRACSLHQSIYWLTKARTTQQEAANQVRYLAQYQSKQFEAVFTKSKL